MKSLKELKQKGRLLRSHMEKAFGKPVSLSQAYEALAAMEGAADWNTLSAGIIGTANAPQAPVQEVPVIPFVASKAVIKACFKSTDDGAFAMFDAAEWFAHASDGQIKRLMKEQGGNFPGDFDEAYGGGGCSDTVAEFFATKVAQVKWVYDYLQHNPNAGSDCYIDADSLNAWLKARQTGFDAVHEFQIGLPQNAKLMRAICAQVWENCEAQWEANGGAGNEYLIQSTEIYNALSDFGVIVDDEDEGYSEDAENQVEYALFELGYHRQARLLYEKKAKLGDAVKVVQNGPYFPATTLPEGSVIVSVFDPCRDGRWFNLDADHYLAETPDNQVLKLVPGYGGRARDACVDGNMFLIHEAQMNDEASDFMHSAAIRSGSFVPAHTLGVKEYIAKNRPHLLEGAVALPSAEVDLSLYFKTLNVLEINLVDLLNDYDLPEDTPEWGWIEANHRFAHKGNNVEPGVWEFMVNVEQAETMKEAIPPVLKPFFKLAKEKNVPWVLFHQG